jgi:hypothetical protein
MIEISRKEVNKMETDTLTGYGVHTLANKALQAANLEKIPPQMVYSYISNKLIPTVLVGTQKRVTREAAEAWVTKFVANRVRRANEAQTETEESVDVEIEA